MQNLFCVWAICLIFCKLSQVPVLDVSVSLRLFFYSVLLPPSCFGHQNQLQSNPQLQGYLPYKIRGSLKGAISSYSSPGLASAVSSRRDSPQKPDPLLQPFLGAPTFEKLKLKPQHIQTLDSHPDILETRGETLILC